MTISKRGLMGSLIACVAFALTATVAAAAPAVAADRSAAGHAPTSLTTLNLSYVPFTNDSSLFLGIKEGFFAQKGIRLKLSTAANPGVIIAGLESGENQIGFAATVEAIDATAHGTNVKCISNVDGNQSANAATDGTMILANPKSGITSVKDLVGKTVATVQTSSLNSLTTDQMVRNAGGDPGKIRYVEMGFAEMPQALARGTVQAAVVTLPFSLTAVQEGMRVIAHPNVAIMADQTTVCFLATDSWLDHHVTLAHAFQSAMDKSIVYSKSHQKQAAATLPGYGLATSVAQAEAASKKLGTDWDPTLKASSFVRLEQLMERYGFIQKSQAPSPQRLILSGT